MSRDARIEMAWADGTYAFRLGWGEFVGLQEACDAGPFVILNRLQSGAWRVQDLSSVIRFGLIGGGLEPTKALTLTRLYVEGRPPTESLLVAEAILTAGLVGAPDEPLGKGAAADQRSA